MSDDNNVDKFIKVGKVVFSHNFATSLYHTAHIWASWQVSEQCVATQFLLLVRLAINLYSKVIYSYIICYNSLTLGEITETFFV